MIFASQIYTLHTLWSVSQGYLEGREGEIRSKYAIYVPAIVCLACHNLSRIASVTLLSAHRVAVPVVSIVAYLPRYYCRYARKGARENERECVCMCQWGGNSFLLTITPLLCRASPIFTEFIAQSTSTMEKICMHSSYVNGEIYTTIYKRI